MSKNYYTNIKVNAAAEDVYAALTNPFAIELWTGYPAKMCTQAGTEFEMWEGDICGMNKEFVENKLIVQQWYFGDEAEESIVKIHIEAKSASRTNIRISHTNIPDEAYDDIAEGWEESYLKPLKVFLEEE